MDIILTGIARSGTTLACSLLNRLPQCVALHEPIQPANLAGICGPEAYLNAIGDVFLRERTRLLECGMATSKAMDGRIPDNPFGRARGVHGLRSSNCTLSDVRFDKPLAPGFRLVIKQPGVFTATLAALLTRFPGFAIVRNPLAVMLSWHSVAVPANMGRMPLAESFDPTLKSMLDAAPDRIDRQLILLRWCFSTYRTLLPRDHVIRYEELIATRGRALTPIDPAAGALNEPLENRNANDLYDVALVHRIADRLLADESIYASFYAPSDIVAVRDLWPGCD
jgi:hypothetical protein